MAKDKRRKKKPAKGPTKQPNTDRPPTSGLPGLSKEIGVIRREVVKVEYFKREVLHELWPELFLHPTSQLESSLFRAYGSYKGGLTRNEIEELKSIRLEAKALHERLVTIYFRLKFKS